MRSYVNILALIQQWRDIWEGSVDIILSYLHLPNSLWNWQPIKSILTHESRSNSVQLEVLQLFKGKLRWWWRPKGSCDCSVASSSPALVELPEVLSSSSDIRYIKEVQVVQISTNNINSYNNNECVNNTSFYVFHPHFLLHLLQSHGCHSVISPEGNYRINLLASDLTD